MLSLSPGGTVDGPGEEGWTTPKQNLSNTLHTAPQGLQSFLEILGKEIMLSFSPWVGLGGPGEACVEFG